MVTLSLARSSLSSTFIDCTNRGNLLPSAIEPETSIRNTRFDAGRLSVGMFFPCNPIFSNLWLLFQGQSLYSVLIENGCWSFGCGYWYLKKFTISSTRTASFGTVWPLLMKRLTFV